MRNRAALAFCLGAVLSVLFATVASANFTTFVVGNLFLRADVGVTPRVLPKHELTPVTLHLAGEISSRDGGHPSAFREAVIDFDRDGVVNARGLPACRKSLLEVRTTKAAKQACPQSIVGEGRTKVEISFPESVPILIDSPVIAFIGGVKGAATTLYLHAYITQPVQTAVVTTVTVTKIHSGPYGLRTVFSIPKIAGGAGSILSFDLSFWRTFTYKGQTQSYFEARCPDGHFNADIRSATFRNEADDGETTTLKGLLVRPCTPKG